MLLFLLKASLVIATLLAFYKAILERESFFRINRIYLLAGLGLAVLLPFLSLPKVINHQGYLTNWAEKKSVRTVSLSTSTDDWEVKTTVVTRYPQQKESQGEETTDWKEVSDWEEVAQEEETNMTISPPPAPTPPPPPFSEETKEIEKSPSWSWQFILLGIYTFGVLILLGNLIAQIISIFIKARRAEDAIKADGSILINLEEESEPCSFFQYIFIHPDSYDFETYEQIVAHEKIHVHQRHSWDLLFAELVVAFLWFNPFVWLFRREIEKNIEYQTDYLLTESAEQTVKKDYQLSLVKIAAKTQPLAVTTNYNQSLIKQRILKMNSKRSNPYSYWKYAFVLPLLVGIALAMNQPLSDVQLEALTDNMEEIPAIETDEPFDELMQAIRDNDFEKVKSLLDKKVNFDKADEEGFTPLLLAAQLEHNEIAQLLTNEHLKEAGFHFDFEEEKIVDAVESNFDTDKSDFELLMKAIKEGEFDFVQYFLEKDIDLNQEDRHGFTPLMLAASENEYRIALLLIQNGADINYSNRDGWTAIIEAADEGSYETAILLLENGATLETEGNWGRSALYMAASEGHIKMLELLLEKGADLEKSYVLHAAAEEGKSHIVRYLLEKGVDVNWTDQERRTALMYAAEEGHLDIVKRLVEAGADINHIDNRNHSALLFATGEGNTRIIAYLLENGASTTISNQNILQVAMREGDEEAFNMLLDHQQTNSEGDSKVKRSDYDIHFFIEAIDDGDARTVRSHIEKGIDVNQTAKNGWTPLIAAADESNLRIIKLLIEAGADINQTADNGWSPLMEAIDERDLATVKYLIEKNADLDAQTTKNHNENYYINNEQFLYSVSKGWNALFEAIDENAAQIAEYLLQNGADINATMTRTYQSKKESNWTPLMEAAVRGQLDMVVMFFIHYNPDKDAKTSSGLTAMDIAEQAGHDRVVEFLKTQ
ncbi:MAG: ankyrin repeat domain-containing protein [Bacteroidota bacterium]